VAIFTAPINLFVDFIFKNILSAPTADEIKLQANDTAIQRTGRRASNAIRRASITASTAMNDVLSRRMAISKRNSVIAIPEKVRIAQELAIVTSDNVVSSFIANHKRFKSNRDVTVRSNSSTDATENSLRLTDLVYNNVDNMSSWDHNYTHQVFEELSKEITLQRRHLRPKEQVLYDAQFRIILASTDYVLFLIALFCKRY
jgi:hypothetical protein